jgi:hypothetical protein
LNNSQEVTQGQYLGFLSLKFDSTFIKNIELILSAKSVNDYRRKYPFALAPKEVYEDFKYEMLREFKMKAELESENFDSWKAAIIDTCTSVYLLN